MLAAPAALRIRHPELASWLTRAFRAAGTTEAEAGGTAAVLAEADLRGVHTHGAVRFKDYAALVREGTWRAGAAVEPVASAGSLLLLDGGNGVGPYVALRAVEAATELARETGSAWVWVRNAGHFGPAAAYTMRIAAQGMFGLAFTNSSPAMAPWGGTKAALGANPWSIAVPRGEDEWPLVLDIANTVVARGRVKLAAARGDTVPEGWGLDRDGNPTANPRDALQGSLLPFGDHKGYAIAFMVEALAAAVSGSAATLDVKPPLAGIEGPQGVGQLFMAADVGAITPRETVAARLAAIVETMRASGGPGVLVPGEREATLAVEQARDGIALPAEVWAALRTGAELVGLDPPTPL